MNTENINNIENLHNKAIELSETAFIQKFRGNIDAAIHLFKEALGYEKQAALEAWKYQIGEPSVSILFRSAASLALNCNEIREAEKIISLALSGEPPSEIAEELRNLLEDVYFQRHLSLNGVKLGSAELQLVVAGKGIGYGMGKSDEVFSRINTLSQLTFRTAERRLGKPFRTQGISPKEIRHNFQPYISNPRSASLAFTIRLGASQQKLFQDTETPESIINEVVENIALINQKGEEELKRKITDDAYYRNFISLSKELAPDGNDVNLVGITIIRDGKEKQVEFRRQRKDLSMAIPKFIISEVGGREPENIITINGKLSGADSEEGRIKIITDDATKYHIIVPEGLGDIVKNYWDEVVQIKGVRIKKRTSSNTIRLLDLDPIKE